MKRLRAELMNPPLSSVPLLPIGSSDDNTDNDKPMEMQEILDKLYEYVANKEVVSFFYIYIKNYY